MLAPGGPLALWGGVECTVNRLRNTYRDQLVLTGHDAREADIELIAGLGISAVRYPVLWERIAPAAPDQRDWAWSDRRLRQLFDHGITPIVGLVHHGSGPRYTSLIADNFASGLQAFAGSVARRYPWIQDWTPVNEPLTTARFSALYGHWYPHATDERLFLAALLNQIDATRMAMRAIRQVNPDARLIQTEDLGRTYSTAALAAQAGHDNARRWLTWDLLTGRVTRGHTLWDSFRRHGFEDRLRAIADDPCPPDVIGLNHYLTSDRFLDHRLQRYPAVLRGGNAQRAYADVEACRVLTPAPQGLEGAIREAWARYRLPLAVTEVHNGCSREEQLRWFEEAWTTAAGLRAAGVDLRAVTAWALFGSVGWDTLLTGGGRYEAGAFDVRGPVPRPTALARAIAGSGGERSERSTGGTGWWHRELRLHYPPARLAAPARLHREPRPEATRSPPILIVGAAGTLGGAMAAACRHRGLPYVLTGRGELDVLDRSSIATALDRHGPSRVINCSGWVKVDEAERSPAECLAVNSDGAAMLAGECAIRGIHSATFSSDLVFGGRRRRAYLERDLTAPRNTYGRSKVAMERAILDLAGDHLIVRTAAFFSPFDETNFAVQAARALARGERFAAARDRIVTPTYVPDLCDATLDLLIDRERGIWHLSNHEALTWADFARRVADRLGYDATLIDAVPAREMAWIAKRPRSSALASERGNLLPALDSAIERFAARLAR